MGLASGVREGIQKLGSPDLFLLFTSSSLLVESSPKEYNRIEKEKFEGEKISPFLGQSGESGITYIRPYVRT